MRVSRSILPLLGLCLCAVACWEGVRVIARDGRIASDELTAAQVAKHYPTYRKITPEPVMVNPELATLCRRPDMSDVEKLRVRYGPHAHTAILIFMSDLAAEVFSAKSASYPPGSVIVKQKTLLDYYDPATKKFVSPHPAGVGGMIKHAPGYDVEHGDWEYFYFDDPEKIESGKIASCIDCHGNAKARDHVFGSWNKEPKTSR